MHEMQGEAHGMPFLKKDQHCSHESEGALSKRSGEKRDSEVDHVMSLQGKDYREDTEAIKHTRCKWPDG